jgi:DNA (cytosine-5)-methyltransferase 1
MKTVELFSGIGGFRIASDLHGTKTVWANDICPKACRVYRHRFGKESICEGDVRKLLAEIPPHELLTGGFPCQPFSSAGKKRGIKDPRGTLFSVVVEVLQRHKPRFFVLENVKRLLHMERGVHFATILSSLAQLDYQIEWRLLNAIHFGLPQNRQRVFIIGVRSEGNATGIGRSMSMLPIRLATPEDASCLGPTEIDWIRSPGDWTDIGSHGIHFPNWGLAWSTRFFAANMETFAAKEPQVMLKSVLQDEVAAKFDFTESTLERIGGSVNVDRFIDGVEILSNQKGGARMGYTVFGINGVAPTLTSTASRHYERYKVGERYRRLTNVEYARIQGFPDDHCAAISVYDQYALFGNAVPPPMAAWVIGRLGTKGFSSRSIPRKAMQKELFADAY